MSQGMARDLVGGRLYWSVVALSLVGLIAAFQMRGARAWIALGVLVMWTAFSLGNAVRSRRVHSIVTAPVYFLAALTLAGAASGRIDVQMWMVWILAAGMIVANLSEWVFGKYL